MKKIVEICVCSFKSLYLDFQTIYVRSRQLIFLFQLIFYVLHLTESNWCIFSLYKKILINKIQNSSKCTLIITIINYSGNIHNTFILTITFLKIKFTTFITKNIICNTNIHKMLF